MYAQRRKEGNLCVRGLYSLVSWGDLCPWWLSGSDKERGSLTYYYHTKCPVFVTIGLFSHYSSSSELFAPREMRIP